MGDLIKNKKLLRIQQAKASNTRERNIAKQYFNSGPSIGNLARAAYHWWNSVPGFGGEDESGNIIIGGEAPTPGMRNPKLIVRLFRATGTSGKFKSSLDGTKEFSGQWFTDNIRKPLRYASNTFKKAKINKETNPVELQVVEIPTSEINKYKASELLKGRTDIDYEPTEDFLIPLDYPRQKYPIEGLTGNLLLDVKLKLPIEKQGGQIVKNFKQKFQFGGKYTYDWKNSPIKTSYGYPVYWSNNVPEEYKWVTDYLKNNPNVTGMAVGEGTQGLDDVGPRVIIRNSNSNILTDPKDPRWNGLDKIEAVRHYMNESNYNPYFKISPELEYFRRTNFSKDAPYNTDDDAWRQSIISRIIAGDMDGTPEQMKIVDKFEKDFYKLKGNGEYW